MPRDNTPLIIGLAVAALVYYFMVYAPQQAAAATPSYTPPSTTPPPTTQPPIFIPPSTTPPATTPPPSTAPPPVTTTTPPGGSSVPVVAPQAWSGSVNGIPDGGFIDFQCNTGAAPSFSTVVYGGANVTSYANQIPLVGGKKTMVVLPNDFQGTASNGAVLRGNLGPDPAPGVPKAVNVTWSCPSGTGASYPGATSNWTNVSAGAAPPAAPAGAWSGGVSGADGEIITVACNTTKPTWLSGIYGGSSVLQYLNSLPVIGNSQQVVVLPNNIAGTNVITGVYTQGNLGPDPAPGTAKTFTGTYTCPDGAGASLKGMTTNWMQL